VSDQYATEGMFTNQPRRTNLLDTAVILAVGNKAHQSQLTYNRPRTMLPALGKPLVVRVMTRLHRIGINRFIVILGEKEGAVATYLNERWLPDVEIEYIIKLETHPLGQTLAGIFQSARGPVLFSSYHSFTHGRFPERLMRLHEEAPNSLIICGAPNSLTTAQEQNYAIVDTEANSPNDALLRPEAFKHGSVPAENAFVLANLAVLGTDFIEYIQQATDVDLKIDTFFGLADAYHLTGQHTSIARTSWTLELVADEDLITLNRHLLDEKIDANILSEIPYTVTIHQPVRVDPGVSIGQGAVIGPYTYLESGCSVGHNTSIVNSIVMSKATVPPKAEVRRMIISTRAQVQV